MKHWLKRLAVISLLGFPVGLVGVRIGLFDFKIGMLLVAISLLLALVVFLFSAFCLLKRKTTETKPLKFALLLSAIPMIGIGSVIIGAGDVPKTHNISTDVIDPPSFNKIAGIRTAEHNSLEYDSALLAEAQQVAYPGVKTFYVDLSRQDAQARAVEVVATLGWDLIDNNTQMNIVEASYTSGMWAFTDDIVIRVRSNQGNDRATIDLRSVSRVGQSDLGANAKRIQKFIEAYNSN